MLEEVEKYSRAKKDSIVVVILVLFVIFKFYFCAIFLYYICVMFVLFLVPNMIESFEIYKNIILLSVRLHNKNNFRFDFSFQSFPFTVHKIRIQD